MSAGHTGDDDLLSLMLHSNYQTKIQNCVSDNKKKGMTIDEVIEECKQFYLAGQETTSSLLTWTLIILAMHPSWQERARKEVHEICGHHPPNFEAISHLKIVNMILYEVLRLYPPVVERTSRDYNHKT